MVLCLMKIDTIMKQKKNSPFGYDNIGFDKTGLILFLQDLVELCILNLNSI